MIATSTADLSVLTTIFNKVVDEVIHYREAMLQVFLGTGAVFAGLVGWYASRATPDFQTSLVFFAAVLMVSAVTFGASGVLQRYIRDALHVLNGCEEVFGCWEEGKFLAGRTLMPPHWQFGSTDKWSEAFVLLHRRFVLGFVLASLLLVGLQNSHALLSAVGVK